MNCICSIFAGEHNRTQFCLRDDPDGKYLVISCCREDTIRKDLTPEAVLSLQETHGGQVSKDDVNPKDAIGKAKVAFALFPFTAQAHASHAMMDGAHKYGPYNWREKRVSAEVYVHAAIRHIANWFEREETAGDSGAHHLGHAIACCAILLDAQETGHLLDDRPKNGAAISALLEKLNKAILEKGLHIRKEQSK
jgi:hypothetical protein